ncbi:MAG: hypothetical protein LQ350_003010 [Teloschistes chrysophthalmus]|nr:MAG: hypothetical protein LQ350_003010 [Niorma chrysophthalma]
MSASEESPLLEAASPSTGSSLEPSLAKAGKVQQLLLFTGLALAVFVGALDETIVAVAAVPIVSEFDAFPLFSWVSVSYLVTLISVQPVYGEVA